MEQIKKLIEDSSRKITKAGADDLQTLAQLHSNFQDISQAVASLEDLAGNQIEAAQEASGAAADVIQSLIMREIEDTGSALENIRATVETLRELVGGSSDELGDSDYDSLPVAPEVIELPENVDEGIFKEFLSNQPHVLANLEAAILTAESDCTSDNCGLVKAILHNMKGETGLLGLDTIAAKCHDAETLIAEMPGEFPGEQLLATKDWLLQAINQLSGVKVSSSDSCEPEVSVPKVKAAVVTPEPAKVKEAPELAKESIEDLVIAESDIPLVNDFINESLEHLESAENNLLAIEENPHDKEMINAIFRAFHTIKGVAGFLNLKQIGSLAHVAENLLDLARKDELALKGTCVDVVFEAIDVTKHLLAMLSEAVEQNHAVPGYDKLDSLMERIKVCATGQNEQTPRLGELLVEEGVPRKDVNEALRQQRWEKPEKKVGEILVEKELVSPEMLEDTIKKQSLLKTKENDSQQRASGADTRKMATESTVKVSTGRLDSLINMVGELVIAESMVSQDITDHAETNQRLARNIRHLDKTIRDLQELSMSMRMVPVQGVFQKMARLVRDLSRKANKDVDFIMTGADTELDRNVVEAIADPLVHMIRNSVDHGIESPDIRLKAGKRATGTVELKAFHQGGNIVIEIRDDGKGLDREKILAKALDHGIIKEGQELTDSEVFNLIFHAGLSTAEKITDVSGRGVGMDVVRKNIESLRGRVDIDSKVGKGTVFSIRLPLTLAVIDGQVVTVGGEAFIIPTISIEQSLQPGADQISTMQGGKGELVKVRDSLLPVVRLHNLFNIETEMTEVCSGLVVVVADGNDRCCLLVDSLLGQQQVVIKSLGEFLGSIRGVSGGAIMGDGNVSLILDVPGLIKLSSREELCEMV